MEAAIKMVEDNSEKTKRGSGSEEIQRTTAIQDAADEDEENASILARSDLLRYHQQLIVSSNGTTASSFTR